MFMVSEERRRGALAQAAAIPQHEKREALALLGWQRPLHRFVHPVRQLQHRAAPPGILRERAAKNSGRLAPARH